MSIINEFIDALAIEIDTLKKGKGGSEVTVINGELLRRIADTYIYQFSLENFLVILDGTPASIEVDGRDYDCEIISVTGLQIQISINQKLGERIASAKLRTNTWYLLERLKKKFEDNLHSQSRFLNSDKLFLDQNSKIDDGIFTYTPSINDKVDDPNDSQKEAIVSSINEFISIIWGPPGTGKTRTIARAIENHINLGRKVLLLSHSNNAVDQALLKVASQVENTHYKECKLVRLGTPKPEMIEKIEKENFPLILIDNIATFKSKELSKEKEDLSNYFDRLQAAILYLRKINEIDLLVIETQKRLDNAINELKINNEKINSSKNEIIKITAEIASLQEKLLKSKNYSFLKKVFSGLDSKKIESNLKSALINLSENNGLLNILSRERTTLSQTLDLIKEENRKAVSDLEVHLSRSGKTLTEVQNELEDYEVRIRQIENRLEVINKAIDEIKVKIISESMLVATTLTKSYISKEIESVNFDILLVDEASMAPMPMLYWAASKITKGITIVGDFKQLPPICKSKDDLAIKWLGKSIFDELKISDIEQAIKRVKLLNVQYRMHPLISEIVNKRIYNGRLTDHISVKQKNIVDTVSGKATLCLIDTSDHNPWCSQFETGGRFNLINAIICISLLEKILPSIQDNNSVGIITPYRNQARLIQRIAEDRNVLPNPKIRINTVHSFQGGEESVIIFDSVEGEGAKQWSMINENDNIKDAQLLLNVAMTRAETKLYVIANSMLINNKFRSDTFFSNILRHIVGKGKVIASTEIISNLKDEKFDDWITKLNSLKNRPQNSGDSYTHLDFWPAFYNDLAYCKLELVIFSPFMTSDRFGKLQNIFTELVSKGIKIYIISLPPNEQPPIMQGTTAVMKKLKGMGIALKFRSGMHEKIALIDTEVKWIGSLNILSHHSRKEYMERIVGEKSAKELYDKFNLDVLLKNPNINGEFCPLCKLEGNTNFIIPRYSKKTKQMFYGCSGYPKCKFTANINTQTIDELYNSKSNKRSGKRKGYSQSSSEEKEQPENDQNHKDTDNKNDKDQWESQTCYWSHSELPGYKYSKKKNAWYKKKFVL